VGIERGLGPGLEHRHIGVPGGDDLIPCAMACA